MQVENVTLSDNLVGIALLPANGQDSGTADVRDVVAVGASANGGCGYDDAYECIPRSGSEVEGVGRRAGMAGTSEGVYAGCGHR